MTAPLQDRLTTAVAARLGVPVQFIRWDRLPTGADLPVFAVPASHVEAARQLGLTVEAA